MKPISRQSVAITFAAASFLWAAPAPAAPWDSEDDPGKPLIIHADDNGTNSDQLLVRSFERTRGERKRVSFLGVGVSEASEDLASQLGLKPGQGLVVTMIVNNSPAEKAALRRHDVLAELDGQILVDSEQLRKLVQMHAEGDTVNLTVYRGGKKETVTAKLGRAATDDSSMDDDSEVLRGVRLSLARLNNIGPQVDEQVRKATKAIEQEKSKLNDLQREMTEQNRAKIERAIEEARRALERAVREHQLSAKEFDTAAKDMEQMAKNGVDVGEDATVVVQNDLKSAKSIVQTDDSGDYIIVADPKRRLTAHDHAGKLLFDGEIETPEQQAKVPKAVWDKVKPILEQLGTIKPDKSPTNADEEK